MTDPYTNTERNSCAVLVRNCSKTYNAKGRAKRVTVFETLDVTVPRGVMYALLGPSGCGKTTLLKCIMGQSKVDSGSVEIFGRQLEFDRNVTGSIIGYMPQEISLFALLSIEQTLQYYGRILGLSYDYIKSQTEFLVDFLKLPPKETVNNKLSGGQSRRLSFAVAAIHKPRLLILDEPTVGVDPIIRQRMWDFLTDRMREDSTTIILTTHYLEEARSANLVGLLHNGSMIAEGSPNQLMNVWNASSLEDLFYQVCSTKLKNKSSSDFEKENINNREEIRGDISVTGSTNGNHDEVNLGKLNRFPNEIKLERRGFIKFHRLAAVVKKNFIQLIRFPVAFLFLIGLPAISQTSVLYSVSGNIRNLNVGVYSEDEGLYGKMFLETFKSELTKQIDYYSYEDGYRDVLEARILGFIYIQANFSATFTNRFIDNNILRAKLQDAGTVNVTIDKTDIWLALILIKQLYTTFDDLTRNALSEDGFSSNASNIFIQFHFQPKELIGSSPLATEIPTGIISLVFMTQMAASFLFLSIERKNGYMQRSLAIGVTILEVLIGSITIQLLICLLQVSGVLIVAFPIFNSILLGSIWPVIFMAFLSGLSGMSFGLLAAALSSDLLICGNVAYVMLLIILAISGNVMPLEAAPRFFRYICTCLPFLLPGEAMEDIVYRNLGLLHVDVIIAILILIAWIIFPIFLAIFCLHKYVK